MKKFYLFVVCLIIMVQHSNSKELPHKNARRSSHASVNGSAAEAITVAGGNGDGSAANQLSYPGHVAIDAAGNIYVADYQNHRIQKWAPGASAGVTVAGGNGAGSAANQLSNPTSVFIDAAGNMYIADWYNNRIQKWAAGAQSGITVAGGNGTGAAPDQLYHPEGIFVDAKGNVYVADANNNRVQKWAPGALSGITVAGGNGFGVATNQLTYPNSVFVDAAGNIYISDPNIYRVQKWAPGASEGTTVAGGHNDGSADNELGWPSDVFVDGSGNIFVADSKNNRIQEWAPGASAGITVAGGNGIGSAANQLNYPVAIVIDGSSNMYVADRYNQRIQKFRAPAITGSPVVGITVAGGNGSGAADNQLSSPADVFADAAGNIFIADFANRRIQKWSPGASMGATVAGGNGEGGALNQVWGPVGVQVDKTGNIYICDAPNQRIEKWAPGASSGISVAGFNGPGSEANRLYFPQGLFVDSAGNVYVADQLNHRIQKWAPGASAGITVAGGNGQGTAANQLSAPRDVFVDLNGNIYVSDNSRIQKWAPGALSGITVAGGNGAGPADNQLSQFGIFVDAAGNIYIADQGNNRIQKWATGALAGVTVAGGNGAGSAANQLNQPTGVFVDASGNLFVADQGNHRIQKFGASALTYKYYEGDWNTLPDFSTLNPVKTGSSSNVTISVRPAGVDDHFAFLWQGIINIPAPGSYTFETISDDGSRLYFNTTYTADATPLVNNDGLHTSLSATGTVSISSAGSYPIAISFFEKEGGESMEVFWSGPGIPRQRIPDAAFNSGLGGDNTPPGIPANLHVTSKGGNFINLDWDDATDNTGVSAYDVYIGGIKRYTTSDSQITIDSLLPNTSYSFTLKARDISGNSSGFSNALTEITSNTLNGLKYKYYEGAWNTLPDFNTLTPAKTGYSLNVDITKRPPGRNDSFAFLWEGYIRIPAPGNYTFETISDDGSRLYFNAMYVASAQAAVDNDGLHAATSSTGAVYIDQAGTYPIAITFFEKDGGEQMQVFWSGPGLARQLIPNEAFLQTPEVLNPSNGLNYKYYEGAWTTLPNFNTLTPVKTGNSENADLSIRTPGRNDNFGFVWEGYLNITTPGTYTFETISDDGSKLYFNSTYDLLTTATVNNDGLHAPVSAIGSVTISAAGLYPIAITFFEKDGGEQMQVYWTGPGITRQLIPNSAFFKTAPSLKAPLELTENKSYVSAGITKENIVITRVYPNPFNESFKIDFYNGTSSNDIHVCIYDLKGRLLYTQVAGGMPAGNSTLTLNLSGRGLTPGVYVAKLYITGLPPKIMKMIKLK